MSGYEQITVSAGWKQVSKELAIGVGIKESYEKMVNIGIYGRMTDPKKPELIVQATVISGDVYQGYSPETSSTTPFLSGEIDLTKANITRLLAKHYFALPLPQSLGIDASTSTKKTSWIRRILG